jgi:hypothetical protein
MTELNSVPLEIFAILTNILDYTTNILKKAELILHINKKIKIKDLSDHAAQLGELLNHMYSCEIVCSE